MTFIEFLIWLAEVALGIAIIGVACALFTSLVVNAWHNASHHCDQCHPEPEVERADASLYSNGRS